MTAIICNQDTLANAALIQCQQLGYRIPEDISIIGFDDIPIAAYTSPPLTTIRQDRLELGKSGFFALSSLLNNIPISTFLLHAQLIERKSTGKYLCHNIYLVIFIQKGQKLSFDCSLTLFYSIFYTFSNPIPTMYLAYFFIF